MFKVPLCIPDITDAEVNAAGSALRSGWMAHGPNNKELERQFCEMIGCSHAITVNSCTSALFVAVKAMGIRGEVILPSFTFTASANAVVTAGATPVYADVEPESGNLDPASVEKAVTSKTEALMVVHYAGRVCDMDRIMAVVKKHKLKLIEDSAETIGGTWRGKPAGSWGVGCFSFFPTKNITTGEGGLISCNDNALAESMRSIIAHGMRKDTHERMKDPQPWHRSAVDAGYNFRMSNVLAAVGVEQMKRLKQMNARRREIAKRYTQAFSSLKGIRCPADPPGGEHVYQMYVIRVAAVKRATLVHGLRAAGVEASVHFDPPVHAQVYYQGHPEWVRVPLAETERWAAEAVTLPIFPGMTDEQVQTVISAVQVLCG